MILMIRIFIESNACINNACIDIGQLRLLHNYVFLCITVCVFGVLVVVLMYRQFEFIVS